MASYLDKAGHEAVSKAVHEAESKTSGEIVTVLAAQSDGYEDVVLAWAAMAAFAAMSVFALWPDLFLGKIDTLFGLWGHSWTLGQTVSLVILIAVMKFATTWALLQYIPLRFFLIPKPTKAARVRAQAVKHFKVGAESRTTGRTGILIYLSMAERRAEIVADEAIASKVEAEVWGKAMADMITHIKAGDIAAGLAICVEDVSEVLAEHFPRADNDVNELPDRLIEV